MIGNFVEWFDYGIYGYFAPTIVTVFFPGEDRSRAAFLLRGLRADLRHPAGRWRVLRSDG